MSLRDLCRELVQEEDNVTGAESYGTRGQRQFGVDLLIDYKDGSLGAGQCKSHQSCNERLIRTACDDFLEHAARWKKKGVRTFILFLAADTRRTQLHDERLNATRQAAAEGLLAQGLVRCRSYKEAEQATSNRPSFFPPHA